MNQRQYTRWIRISCATLCRIEHPGLGYLLLLNRNRRQKGLYVLSAVGGALEYHDDTIMQRFNATPEMPTSADLRLMLPVDQLPAFRDWFYSGEGRETSPFRELHEELVYESKILTALAPDDVQIERLWTIEREQFTQRKGQTGLLTHYFLEVYAVRLVQTAALAQLIAVPPDAGARWLSAEQIRGDGPVTMHIDGVERQVSVNGRVLLDPPDEAAPS